MNALGGLFFLLLGTGMAIYSVSTGRHLSAGMTRFNRDRRPKDFWFFVSFYGLFAVVGLVILVRGAGL